MDKDIETLINDIKVLYKKLEVSRETLTEKDNKKILEILNKLDKLSELHRKKN